MKFLGRYDIADKLGYLSGAQLSKMLSIKKFDAVVPVPLHPTRVRERGYDQNLALARSISSFVGIEVNNNLIIRQRNTRPQSRLSDIERSSNLENAFGYNNSIQSDIPHAVLLIDDVIHSGATVGGCVTILKKMSIKYIHIVSICG
jgi:ComF family protein